MGSSDYLATKLAQLWQALYCLLMVQRRLRRNLKFYTEFLHYSEHNPIAHAEELASIEAAKNEDFELQACRASYDAARLVYLKALTEAKLAAVREYSEASRVRAEWALRNHPDVSRIRADWWVEGDWQIRIIMIPEFDSDSAMIMETEIYYISLTREAAEELRFCVDVDSNLVFTGKRPNIAEFLASYARDYLAGNPRRVCPFCGTRVDPSNFRDNLSLREYRISGLCQSCQDSVFA